MTPPPLAASEFPAVFEAVHGVPPFPWQCRLVDRLASGGGWPEALDLPTGAGKTAALDAALFHLALQASAEAGQRQAPVRIAFVVDRRIIVDAAAARADAIGHALRDATGDDPLARMAARLRHLAGPGAPPLTVARLRGGLPREEDWARSPSQPTILCSTVDQVGSRLLFRGYGISDSMKPVHAGLLGSDCLMLLDEAHLAAPFVQTLRRIATYRAPPWCEASPGAWGFVSLSATQNATGPRFALEAADRTHPVLKARLETPKPARLRGLSVQTGTTEHAIEFAKAAKAMLRPGQGRVIAVVVNRVALARAVLEALTGAEADLLLLTGRIRALDRDALLAEHGSALMMGAARGARSLIIVATQTIEAGADFDFDALVTQAAPLDSLRQRFGRLNRAGRAIDAEAVIIAAKDEIAARAADPVYGDRTKRTWDWLVAKAGRPPKKEEASADFGITALDGWLAAEPEVASSLSSESLLAPILRPTDVLLLSWTAPIPAVDPAIAAFLHGPKAGPADVSIVWRADISEATLDKASEWIALVPPHAGEMLSVPLWAARAWLARDARAAGDTADIEGAPAATAEDGSARRALRWAGADAPATGLVYAAQLRPGDVIVVPASYGGCDSFGWNPASDAAVTDLGDQRGEGRRSIRRLYPDGPGWSAAAAILSPKGGLDIAETLAAFVNAGLIPQARGWRILRPDSYAGAVLLGPGRDGWAATTEDDAAGSVAAQAISLAEHAAEVVAQAGAFATAAGLSAECAADIRLAARLHDAGKADPRFQSMLMGGDRLLAALRAAEPLAKSTLELTSGDSAAARRRAGLPERWRHEAQSVTRAMSDAQLANAHDPELVLWLIGTHHGHGRPLFPHDDPREPSDAPGPQRLDFQFREQDWPQIFERLKARYGPWELARLEAVLRLADHRASAESGA
ncbi:MAG: type I-U CRISPR-associated helicase/endonuclease Cas3 [Roseococcus sp.]|nr:type I-U CRISPR-associated helicase/endonuclease Cas3 [Roseococcus sp.]